MYICRNLILLSSMLNYLRQNPNRLLAILLWLLTVVNLITAGFSELIGDECYYWFVSKNLELGYFDHPPFFGFLNHLGVMLAGDTSLGVRLMTVLIYPVTLYLFWTVVRTENSDYRSALRYFLIVFSIPMLHIYGFVATPDAPLLLATSVTLWAFKRYVYSVRLADNGYLLSIIFLAVGFAMLGYAKYQGALVVLAIIIARPRMLIDWRLYAVAVIALALYVPHLYWQYTHDMVSIKYHLFQRHEEYRIGLTSEYLLNFIGTYNPFLTIPFVIMLVRRSPFVREPIERLMRVMTAFILLFFLYSTFKGAYVQPQWLLPIAFAMIFMICRAAERNAKLARYVVRSSVFMGILIFALHAFVMVVDRPINRVELFGKQKGFETFADSLHDVDLLILDGGYAAASMVNFYSTLPAYARPSIYGRSSHYQYIDMETQYYGHRVAVDIGDHGYASTPADSLDTRYQKIIMPVVGQIYYYIDEHYIPTTKVKIELQSFPAKVLINQNLALMLSIVNPYSFEIPLGGVDGFRVVMTIKAKNGFYWDFPLSFIAQSLGSGGMVRIATSVVIPELETGHYDVGFSLQRYTGGAWYNSKVYDLLIVNPKTRI